MLTGAAGALDGAAAAEASGDDRRDRAVHGGRHQVRKDRAGGTDDHARDDQRRVVQRDPRRRRGEAGEGVEQRDHDRHVGAADRQHDRVSEQRRAQQHADEQQFGMLAGDHGDAGRQGEHEQQQVDELLAPAEADRAPGDNFLELAEGDVRAPEGDRADDGREERRRSRRRWAAGRCRQRGKAVATWTV